MQARKLRLASLGKAGAALAALYLLWCVLLRTNETSVNLRSISQKTYGRKHISCPVRDAPMLDSKMAKENENILAAAHKRIGKSYQDEFKKNFMQYSANEFSSRALTLLWATTCVFGNRVKATEKSPLFGGQNIFPAPPRVLDIGIAYGSFSIFLLEYGRKLGVPVHIDGLDFVAITPSKLVTEAKQIDYRLGNIETDKLPFKRDFSPGYHAGSTDQEEKTRDLKSFEMYDLIFLGEILEHFNFNPVSTFKRLKSVLKPSGSIIVTTPNGNNPLWLRSSPTYLGNKKYHTFDDMPNVDNWKNVKIVDAHVHLFTESEIRQLAKESGLRVRQLVVGKQIQVELVKCTDQLSWKETHAKIYQKP
jgi:SAM-dependent methyltransferase